MRESQTSTSVRYSQTVYRLVYNSIPHTTVFKHTVWLYSSAECVPPGSMSAVTIGDKITSLSNFYLLAFVWVFSPSFLHAQEIILTKP